ncbi:MAG: FIST N-terminal domain-containing protein [Gammaproteobacteria bacterium]
MVDNVLRTEITTLDEREAVNHMRENLHKDHLAGITFFCSDKYDLELLAQLIVEAYDCPVIGCTTAGEIGSTYQNDGIVAASFSSNSFNFHIETINNLDTFSSITALEIAKKIKTQLRFSERFDVNEMFGFLLIDGLSMMEEHVAADLHSALCGVKIIGGSAGDSLTFTKTSVFSGGKFQSGTAAIALIESKANFKVFKEQHYTPSNMEMTITKADPARRIVYEIDGGTAAIELAEIIGVNKDKLSMEVYSIYPVMLQVGDEWYVRSIQNYNEDGSLTFACAIDSGLPLTVGKCEGLSKSLSKQVKELVSQFDHIEMTLGFDCIHRRLEILEMDIKNEVEEILTPLNFLGFSTYGEQYDAIHVNQTLTGVVIGA